jgi:hypothetical protein
MNKLIAIAAALVGALCVMGTTEALFKSCYDCEAVINDKNQDMSVKSCSQVQSDTTVTGVTFRSCETRYTLSPNGLTKIIRRGSQNRGGSTTTNTTYCDEEGSCFCNTDKCNNMAIQAPKSLECYSCDSADYFDNGCGEKIDPRSVYVQKVQGCAACGKTVTFSNYRYKFSRGCARSVNVNKDGVCYKGEMAMSCTCTGSLCNSARGLQGITAAAIGSALLVAVYSITF